MHPIPMNTTLKSITLAAAASLSVVAHAGDKEVLDLLVKKGVITAEERGQSLQTAATSKATSGVDRVFPKQDTSKRLTFGGYFQTQFQSFDYSQTVSGVENDAFENQSGFLMRRLYLEITADAGEGFTGNVVVDLSGNTSSSSSSWLDRAIASKTTTWGTFDLGYRKVAWGYEESTLSTLFKASSSQLYTVERGITNRYWNEAENGTRLGFGAHHTGLHFSSTPNPQGLEFGASVVNPSQGRFSEGKGGNSVGLYANLAFNWKVSDFEKYAVGVNYGRTEYFDSASVTNSGMMSGYNPFIQAQMGSLTVMGEFLSTEIEERTAYSVNTSTNYGRTDNAKPEGYNAMISYKINDNIEAVARYTSLDTDGRGQKIGDGVRGFNTAAPTAGNSGSIYDKSDAIYIGLNYYFTLSAAGASVAGHNAKFQIGYEMATFKDRFASGSEITPSTTPKTYNIGTWNTNSADVNTIRAQFQVAF